MLRSQVLWSEAAVVARPGAESEPDDGERASLCLRRAEDSRSAWRPSARTARPSIR